MHAISKKPPLKKFPNLPLSMHNSSSLRGQAAISLSKLKSRSLKGQAAMEYLMTYGWAILVLLIVVGYIMGSGMINPNLAISEGCNLETTSFNCRAFAVEDNADTILSLSLTNSLGYPVGIYNMTVFSTDGTALASYVPQPDDYRVQSGAKKDLALRLLGEHSSGNNVKNYVLQLNYFSCAPEINIDCALPPEDDLSSVHIVSGTLSTRIAESNQPN